MNNYVSSPAFHKSNILFKVSKWSFDFEFLEVICCWLVSANISTDLSSMGEVVSTISSLVV